MNQSVSKGTISAIVAVVVLVLGLVAWKVFGPGAGSVSNNERNLEFRLNSGAANHAPQGAAGSGMPQAPAGAGTGLPPGQ